MLWTILLLQVAAAMPLLERGEFAAALPSLEQACRENEPNGCYLLGRSLFSLDRYDQARTVLLRIRFRDPVPWRVNDSLGLIEEALGHEAGAESYFKQAVEGNRDSTPEPRLHFGRYLMRQGRPEESVTILRPLARQFPRHALVRFELGRALYQTGKLREASVELAASETPAAALLLAKVRRQLGTDRP